MQKLSHQDNWRNVVFLLVALFVVVADQLSKTWIRAHLLRGQSLFDLGFFQITHVRNSGAAFGLFPGESFTLTIVAVIGVIVVLLYALVLYRRFPYFNSMVGRVALGLVLGGTVGNLTDRLRYGSVTDFIDFKVWPAFNVADSAVTIGVLVFAYCLLRLAKT